MIRTRVGYAGGTKKNPTYHDLGDHTESFQVDFDPEKTSYADLLAIVWDSHNPCAQSWSRQYRSAIFYANDDQKKLALESKAKVEKERGKVTTDIEPLGTFTWAEDYHQKYSLRNSRELAKEFKSMFAKDEDFVNSTAAARVNGYLGGDGTKEQLEKEVDRLGLSDEGKKVLKTRVGDR